MSHDHVEKKFPLGIWPTVVLGDLIAALEPYAKMKMVRYDFGYFTPTPVASYRGFYDHLALGYTEYGVRAVMLESVEKLLAELRGALGKTFNGYKGGDYIMSPETPVWVSNWGESTSTTLVGLHADTHQLVLLTSYGDV